MRNKYRKFMKVCYILPYVIAFSISDILLNEPQDCRVSERLWHSIFGSVTAGEIQSLVYEDIKHLKNQGKISTIGLGKLNRHRN